MNELNVAIAMLLYPNAKFYNLSKRTVMRVDGKLDYVPDYARALCEALVAAEVDSR